MAETVGELLVKIGADVGDLRSQLQTVGVQLDRLAQQGKRTADSLTGLGAATVVLNSALDIAGKAVQPLLDGLGQISDFVAESVEAAGREEEAQNRLANTLRATGQFSQQLVETLNEQAQAFERLTGVQSESITQAQAVFASFGVAADQIEPLTKAALTLSKALGGDVVENARKLALDVEGTSDALGRLGLKHDETAGKAQRLADALAFVANFADPTRIQGYTQQVSALSAAYDDTQKAIGNVIISTPEFQALLTTATATLNTLAETVRQNKDVLIDFVGEGVELAIQGLGVLATTTENVVRLLELVGVAARTITDPLGLVEQIAAGTTLTPLADSIQKSAQEVAAFQQRVEDLAASIRRVGPAAASRQGLGGITDEATRAAQAATGLGAPFQQAADQIVAAGQSTRGAFSGIAGQGDDVARSFQEAGQAASEFGATGRALGPVYDDAGRRIAAAGAASQNAFRGLTAVADTAATQGVALDQAFARTQAQAQLAANGIKLVNDEIASLRLDATTAGIPELQSALATTEANIRAIGAAAGLTGAEIETALSAAVDTVRERFQQLSATDLSTKFQEIRTQAAAAGASAGAAFRDVAAQSNTVTTAFRDASTAATDFGRTGASLGPIYDEAGASIQRAATTSVEGFSNVAQVSAAAAQSGVQLSTVFTRTQEQAAQAAAGISQINEAIANLSIDAGAAGIPQLEAALTSTATSIRAIGAAAGLTGAEIEAALGGAADAVAERFSELGATDIVSKFRELNAQIQTTGASTREAFASIEDQGAAAARAFEGAADKAALLRQSGGALGPVFDEAGRRIDSAGKAAEAAFTNLGEVTRTAAARGAELDQVFDRTREQASRARDAIRQINDSIAGIRLEARTTGLSELDAALRTTEANIRKIGTAAGLTANEMQTALSAAADAVQAKFDSLGQADIASRFRDLDSEIQRLSFRGVDDQLAEFLVHLEELRRNGKLSVQEVALAADQARTKFAELANVRAFGGIANDLAQVRAGVTLFGRSFATVTPVIDKVRAKMVELAAAGRAGTEEFQELNATLQSLEAEQEIEIAVDLDQAKADVEALRSDIESGETQWRISLDRSALERDLEAARTRAASLLEGTPARVQADLDIAQLEADIAALPDPIARRTLELEPEVDTPALNAITGFKEFGTAASPAEILQLGNTFQQAVLDAIRSGDQERLRLLQQQGQEFLKSFEGSIRSLAQGFPLTGFDRPSQEGVQGVTAIRDALNALQGLVSPFSLGGAPFATDFSTALRGLQAEQAQAAGSSSRTADGVETTNSLLGTANDIAAAQLGATQNLQTVITGTQATQRALLDQQRAVRDTTGNRSFVSE